MIEKITKVQEALLRKAIKLVPKENTIIYSTCSILKEENELILKKVKDLVEVVPIGAFDDNKDIKIDFNKDKSGTITIFPNYYFEGFFIAKLVKK